MAQQTINLGTSANDGLGDNLRSAMDKCNDNFDELYGANSVSSNIALSGNTVSTYATNQDIVLGPDGTGTIRTASDLIPDVTNTRYIGNANVRHLGAYIGTAGLITSGPISLASYANATVRDAEITQPSAGMFIYNQDGTQFQGYSGSEWAIMGGNVTNNVGGADTQVQFNDGGAAFGGDAGLTYNKTTDTLTGVTGTFTTLNADTAKVTGNVLVQTDDPNITLRRDDNVKVPGLVWQGAAGTEAASIKLDGTDGESNTIIISSFNGSSVTERIRVKAAGVKVTGNLEVTGAQVDFTALPTSDPGVAGRLYNDSGTVKISAG